MLILLVQLATAAPPLPSIRFDGVIDTYIDAATPATPGRTRAWLTQPRKDRSFDLNLATLGVLWTADRAHARFSVQTGSSVVANYAGEPDPEAVRNIEEAYVGLRPRQAFWVDAGIFSSAIGMEAWRSTENPTYTRSLTADYTPYYSAGIRGTWQAATSLALRLDLLNGWQRIGENNDAKALSARLDWSPDVHHLFGASMFLGNERPDGSPEVVRSFGQLYGRIGNAEGTALWWTADLGGEGENTFGSATAILRRPLGKSSAVVLRGEYYADPDQVVFATGAATGFAGVGGSIGFDLLIAPGVQWRSEARWFSAGREVFPTAAGGYAEETGFLVTALTVRWSKDH